MEHALHLLAGLEVVLGRVAHAIGVPNGLASLDAEQDLVGGMVLPREKVAVVGGDERDAGLAREGNQKRVDGLLLGHPLVLDFQVVVPLPHDAGVFEGDPLGFLLSSSPQQGRDLASQARRQGNQPCRMLAQQRFVDARAVVEALQEP